MPSRDRENLTSAQPAGDPGRDPDPTASPAESRPVGPRRMGVLLAVAVAAYLLDLGTKILAVEHLAARPPVELLGGLLKLRLVRNPGAAFGLGVGMTVVFSVVAIVVTVVILRMSARLYSLPWAVALGLLLGGALGNLTDRLFRSPSAFAGHVVDFLELPHWPVFNVADSSIVVAGVGMVLLSLRGLRPDGTVERPRSGPAGSG